MYLNSQEIAMKSREVCVVLYFVIAACSPHGGCAAPDFRSEPGWRWNHADSGLRAEMRRYGVGTIIAENSSDPILHEITPDPNNPVTAFLAPQWESGTPGRQYPVGYSIGSTMELHATFTLDAPWSGNPIYIGASTWSGGLISFPWTGASVADNTVSVDVDADKAFSSVADYNKMSIYWFAAVLNPGDPPIGTTYDDAGTNSNRTYITYQALSGPLYETCVKIGCDAAAGKTASATPQDVVNAVWTNGFSGRSVSRVDGTQLRYWNPDTTTATNTAQLIQTGDGQCGAWAELFMDTLSAQGISGAQKIGVTSTYTSSPFVTGLRDYRGLMLVKNWTFPVTGAAPADVAPFDYLFAEITDQAGAPGQGNDNPPALSITTLS